MTTGNVADYKGRQFDLLALEGAKLVGEAKLVQEIFGPSNSGFVCTGIQKLAQDWVIEFLLIRGSMLFDPTRGTDFMRNAQAGVLRTESDVVAAFVFAAMAVKEMFGQRIPETAPLDEQLSTARLVGVTIVTGRIEMKIEIASLAGSSAKVILPVNTVPANLAVR